MEPVAQIAVEILEDLKLVSDSTPTPRWIDADEAVANPSRGIVGGRDAANEVRSITDAQRRALQYLRSEPFLVRVIVEDLATGKVQAYLFCRASPPLRSTAKYGTLASYRNNGLGMLAESPADDIVEIELPDGRVKELRILERVRLRPRLDDEGWDGQENIIERGLARSSVRSLREHLRRQAPAARPAVDDIFAEIADEEAAAAAERAAREGARREARRTLSLRDQAILDKFQGHVFRLPLGQRIFLSGPAGTGKTTTLIKRLGQKLDIEFWDEPDRTRVGTADPKSWVMFTPTELLKLYLKEAFAKEQVPAPESCVKTWAAERSRLGRDVLGILKTETGGRFYLKSEPLLRTETSPAVWALFTSFQTFLEAETTARFATAFDAVDQAAPSGELREMVDDLRKRAGATTINYDRLFDLVSRQSGLAKHEKALDEELETKIQSVIRALLGRHPSLLNELATRVDGLLAGSATSEEEEDDAEDVPSVVAGASERARAIRVLTKALPALAAERHQSIRRSTRYGALFTFLGDRVPSASELEELDRLTVLRREVAFLATTHKSLTEGIPAAFQRFRRRGLRDDGPYAPTQRDRIVRGEIGASELDVVILAMLRSVRRLASRPDRTAVGTPLAIVEAVRGEYRVQVLVDEAADFSAVQLGCMYGLSHPTFGSLFAAGDLRQRMTSSGILSSSELNLVAPDFVEEKISIGYRQSPSLTAFASEVAKLIPGGDVEISAYHSEETGNVPPLLREGLDRVDGSAGWIGQRVVEIERSLGIVPSIAIFVSSDAEIAPLVAALKPVLDERHIGVRGCPGGTDVGLESEIRVFSAEYIKGLEFEAVFFVGVDRLAVTAPDLFHQVLYVGSTRATRYLALTCEAVLPASVEHMRRLCGTEWSS